MSILDKPIFIFRIFMFSYPRYCLKELKTKVKGGKVMKYKEIENYVYEEIINKEVAHKIFK